MAAKKTFSKDALKLNCAEETEKITSSLREIVLKQFKKRGAVVGLSGGIDSSVVGALCVRALGAEQVLVDAGEGLLAADPQTEPACG